MGRVLNCRGFNKRVALLMLCALPASHMVKTSRYIFANSFACKLWAQKERSKLGARLIVT